MDNFVVSARKYRPATFASVVGQTHITSTLKNAIARNQLAHAYLFCGPRGVGKTTCARIFAKAINCLNPNDSEACNECESCRSFNEGRSFNIHELDAASNNSVDDIRTLTEQVRIPPQIGRYSVYIIDEVHMLSAAAFNAFLKTLEEPPAHAVFILATTEKHKIIPTILSRCQIYDFNRIRVEDGVEYLKYIASQEGVAYDDESLHLIARKADGGMRDALSMFDKAVAFCGNSLNFKEVARTLNVLDYDTYFSVTSTILTGDYRRVLLAFDEVLRNGFSGQIFMSGLGTHFRDLLMCKDPSTQPLLEVTGSVLQRYREQSTACDTGFLFEAISLLSGVDAGFRTATNQRLHAELALMKLCGLGQKKNSLKPDDVALPPLKTDGESNPVSKSGKDSKGGSMISGINAAVMSEGTAHSSQTVISQDGSAPVLEPSHSIPSISASPVPGPTVAADIRLETVSEKSAAKERNRSEGEDVSADQSEHVEAPMSHKTVTPAFGRKEREESKNVVSGFSVSNIMNGGSHVSASENDNEPTMPKVDPESAGKITAAATLFLDKLTAYRPRLKPFFEGMEVAGNTITVTVPTELLKEDIMRNSNEILSLLCRTAGVTGRVELKVDLKEVPGGVRPIKPEDKYRHLVAKNSMLNQLREELELEIE